MMTVYDELTETSLDGQNVHGDVMKIFKFNVTIGTYPARYDNDTSEEQTRRWCYSGPA